MAGAAPPPNPKEEFYTRRGPITTTELHKRGGADGAAPICKILGHGACG